jgi:hypothetical protein
MNMNKKIIDLFLFLILLFIMSTFEQLPTFAATNFNGKQITSHCKCNVVNGKVDCASSGCTDDFLTNDESQLKKQCNLGKIEDIKYSCVDYTETENFYSGATVQQACETLFSHWPDFTSMRAEATATCNMSDVHVATNFCDDISGTMRFIGYIWLFLKYLIPLMIIFVGIIDLSKAITTDKDSMLKDQLILFGKRVLAGVIFFLIPTILNITLNTIDKWVDNQSDYEKCTTCLFDPKSCDVDN